MAIDALELLDKRDRNNVTKEYYENRTISTKNNEIAEEILVNNRYYGFIKILDIISSEINHRCIYCCINLSYIIVRDMGQVKEDYMCCNDETCVENCKEFLGFGVGDYLLLHGLEFELLLSFYISSSMGGRGFLNAPVDVNTISTDVEEQKRIINENDIKAIKKIFKRVISEDVSGDTEGNAAKVNELMGNIIKLIPRIDQLKVY